MNEFSRPRNTTDKKPEQLKVYIQAVDYSQSWLTIDGRRTLPILVRRPADSKPRRLAHAVITRPGRNFRTKHHGPLAATVVQSPRIVPEHPAQRTGQRGTNRGDAHNSAASRNVAPMFRLPAPIQFDDSDLIFPMDSTWDEDSRHLTAFLQSAPPTAGASGGLRAEREGDG